MIGLRARRGSVFVGVALAAWMGLVPFPLLAAPEQTASPPPASEEGLGAIRGVLYGPDETARLYGATVTAINVRTGRRYVSNFTGENGAYEILSLPAGQYDLAIDSADRVYVPDTLIDLAEGQRLLLSFSVKPDEPGPPGTAGLKGAARMTFTSPAAVPQTGSKPAKKGFWHRGGGKALLAILVAGAIGAGAAAQRH